MIQEVMYPIFSEEVDPFYQIVDRLAELYVSYRGRFVTMSNTGKIFIQYTEDNGTKVPVKLSNAYLCAHVNHRIAVSVYAGPYSAKFLCFDVDDGNPGTVRKIIDLSEEAGIPRSKIYVSSSGGKGYHVEIFFDSLVYVSTMRDFYNWVCFKGGIDRNKVEFRPTHGQAIKLPLSRNFKTGNVCWFLDRETLSPIIDRRYILGIEQVSAQSFSLISEGLKAEYQRFFDPLPCDTEQSLPVSDIIVTDDLPELTAKGTTHKTILAIAIYLRGKGMSEETIVRRLVQWFHEQPRQFVTDSDKAVMKDIDNAASWVWSENFVPPTGKAKIPEFGRMDMIRILSCENKVDRRVLFLIMYYEKRFGKASLSYDRIARMSQISYVTAVNSINRLIDAGYITCKHGKSRLENTTFVRDRNTYWVVQQTLKASIPFISDTVLVENELTEENAVSEYYALLQRMIDRAYLKKVLTRSELNNMEDLT